MHLGSVPFRIMSIAVVLIALATGVYTLRAGLPQLFSTGLQSTSTVVCPGPTNTAGGLPLIQPRNDCTPSFTEQDVRDYLRHAIPLGRIEMVGTPSVNMVVFTTIGDLNRAAGHQEFAANYPASMVVCYVELSGIIRGSGSLIPPTPATSSYPSAGTAFFVLDGRTGNELVVGTPAPIK